MTFEKLGFEKMQRVCKTVWSHVRATCHGNSILTIGAAISNLARILVSLRWRVFTEVLYRPMI
jgi:hypothetical protein